MSKQKTNEQFLEELAIINPMIIPRTKYIKAREKILVECLECGNKWETTPDRLLRGNGCRKCSMKRVHDQQRKSNEQFAEEVLKINPTIKLLSEYKGKSEKVLIECLLCGERREVWASQLLKGVGCNKCNLERRANNQAKSHNTFVEEMGKINPSIIILGEYSKSKTKIQVQCTRCGYIWDAFPSNLLKGHGCKRCVNKQLSDTRMMPHEEYVDKLGMINPDIEVIGIYRGNKNHIEVKCKKCGECWEPNAGSLLAGRGCPKCAIKQRADKNRRTNDGFLDEVKKSQPNVCVLGKYESVTTPIRVMCKTCGYIWDPIPTVLLRGGGCPNCAGNLTKQHDVFVQELEKINPSISVIGKYVNGRTNIAVKCLECGNTWKATPQNLLKGTGCPKCCHAPTSFSEQVMFEAFKAVFGEKEVKSRNKQSIGRELDILLPKYKTAVEIGSWYWHKPRIKQDTEKKRLCEQKEIRLIFIFDSFSEESKPFDQDCIVFEKDLGAEKGNITLKKLITNLAEMISSQSVSISEAEWDQIIKQAYSNSRMRTTEDFKAIMQEIDHNIEVVGEYTRSRNKIKCKCRICGNVWENTPYHLMKGEGCPKCSIKRRAKARTKAVINLETGERFDSAALAAESYNCKSETIKNCCRGTIKTCKGFHWVYETTISDSDTEKDLT